MLEKKGKSIQAEVYPFGELIRIIGESAVRLPIWSTSFMCTQLQVATPSCYNDHQRFVEAHALYVTRVCCTTVKTQPRTYWGRSHLLQAHVVRVGRSAIICKVRVRDNPFGNHCYVPITGFQWLTELPLSRPTNSPLISLLVTSRLSNICNFSNV